MQAGPVDMTIGPDENHLLLNVNQEERTLGKYGVPLDPPRKSLALIGKCRTLPGRGMLATKGRNLLRKANLATKECE